MLRAGRARADLARHNRLAPRRRPDRPARFSGPEPSQSWRVSHFGRARALHDRPKILAVVCPLVFAVLTMSCGDGGTEAQKRGIGAACTMAPDCTETGQSCLTQFKGGYCGVQGCTADVDCPDGSACVTHDDGVNYCFLVCEEKPDCNRNRSVENEANCSSSAVFVEPDGRKACTPPSGV